MALSPPSLLPFPHATNLLHLLFPLVVATVNLMSICGSTDFFSIPPATAVRSGNLLLPAGPIRKKRGCGKISIVWTSRIQNINNKDETDTCSWPEYPGIVMSSDPESIGTKKPSWSQSLHKTPANNLRSKAEIFIQTGQLEEIKDGSSNDNAPLTMMHESYWSLAAKNLQETKLSGLKKQIDEEKRELIKLQAKEQSETAAMQRVIKEKDIMLHKMKSYLDGVKEVHIDYWANCKSMEVSGSFNGWQHRIMMEMSTTSDSRHLPCYSTVLWLYPGVYEIKFIIDGHWIIDPRRETVTRGGITNNILMVHE